MFLMTTTLPTITWSRLLPWAAFGGNILLNLLLDIWLLKVLRRQGVGKRLPWFALYISWDLVTTVVFFGMWLAAPRFYLPLAWWLQFPSAALLVAAMQESLLNMFEKLRQALHWFLPGVIAFVTLYTTLRALLTTSFPGNRFISFELTGEFTFRCGLAVVGTAAALMIYFVPDALYSLGFLVVAGISIISGAYIVWSDGLSAFGLHILFIAKYLPSLGYLAAAIVWIKMFSRPIQPIELKDLGMGLEEVRERLGLFARILEMMRRLW
jgi:hypothetical protein